MKQLLGRLEALQGGGPQLVRALMGIGGVAIVLLVLAVAGAMSVDGGSTDDTLAVGAGSGDGATATTVADAPIDDATIDEVALPTVATCTPARSVAARSTSS